VHEAAIAQGIIDEVLRLRDEGAWSGRLVRINLRVGKLTATVPDYLSFCFQALSSEGPLAGVELAWEHVPVAGQCKGCGQSSEFSDIGFLCPSCGSFQVEITQGRELLIDSLEVDDDD